MTLGLNHRSVVYNISALKGQLRLNYCSTIYEMIKLLVMNFELGMTNPRPFCDLLFCTAASACKLHLHQFAFGSNIFQNMFIPINS